MFYHLRTLEKLGECREGDKNEDLPWNFQIDIGAHKQQIEDEVSLIGTKLDLLSDYAKFFLTEGDYSAPLKKPTIQIQSPHRIQRKTNSEKKMKRNHSTYLPKSHSMQRRRHLSFGTTNLRK